jgi:hypothetical protein
MIIQKGALYLQLAIHRFSKLLMLYIELTVLQSNPLSGRNPYESPLCNYF